MRVPSQGHRPIGIALELGDAEIDAFWRGDARALRSRQINGGDIVGGECDILDAEIVDLSVEMPVAGWLNRLVPGLEWVRLQAVDDRPSVRGFPSTP